MAGRKWAPTSVVRHATIMQAIEAAQAMRSAEQKAGTALVLEMQGGAQPGDYYVWLRKRLEHQERLYALLDQIEEG